MDYGDKKAAATTSRDGRGNSVVEAKPRSRSRLIVRRAKR